MSEMLRGLGAVRSRFPQTGRGAERRAEEAGRVGPPAAGPPGRAAARRARQPPRPGGQGLPGTPDPRVSRHGGDRLARPLPAGRGGHPHRRNGGWAPDHLRRGLLRLTVDKEDAPGAPGRAVSGPAARDRPPGSGDQALRPVGQVYDNEKFAQRAQDHAEGRLRRMDKLERPVLERRRMGLQLNGWRGSNKVLELDGLANPSGSKAGAGRVECMLIWHGERVGLIGPNGAGKSVLLRLILGQEQPDPGEIILGPSVKVGYYAQEHETLDLAQTLMEAVRRAAATVGAERGRVSASATCSPTGRPARRSASFPGGERSRLQLALLVLSGANFLLLDEPTNNLDIASAEVLENALADFVGTVLVISHDRYFLDRIVSRIWLLEDGNLAQFLGGYSDYVQQSTTDERSGK